MSPPFQALLRWKDPLWRILSGLVMAIVMIVLADLHLCQRPRCGTLPWPFTAPGTTVPIGTQYQQAVITGGFSLPHAGVDLPQPTSSVARAVEKGVIVYEVCLGQDCAGEYYGLVVASESDPTHGWFYQHIDSTTVEGYLGKPAGSLLGTMVEAGDELAHVVDFASSAEAPPGTYDSSADAFDHLHLAAVERTAGTDAVWEDFESYANPLALLAPRQDDAEPSFFLPSDGQYASVVAECSDLPPEKQALWFQGSESTWLCPDSLPAGKSLTILVGVADHALLGASPAYDLAPYAVTLGIRTAAGAPPVYTHGIVLDGPVQEFDDLYGKSGAGETTWSFGPERELWFRAGEWTPAAGTYEITVTTRDAWGNTVSAIVPVQAY